jgi:hypothetical protein
MKFILNLKTLLVCFAISMTASLAMAGADHDHGAPTFQPPKGGILKSTAHLHYELVENQGIASLYVYNQEGKAQPTKGIKITAELELPRKKSSPISFEDKSTHWETKVNSQGAHRYTLKVHIDDGKDKDYVKFTIEKK